MTVNASTEDQLVEQPAIGLLPEAITADGLIEWLTADFRESLISSRFLFK